VDTYGSYAFGFLHTDKKPECAAALVHNDVLPFYREHGLTVGAILTDNGREFCGTQNHPFELYLALNDIEHRRTKVKSGSVNSFVLLPTRPDQANEDLTLSGKKTES
jgi:acyl-CoA synthetase (AMP-forming)/AMP-acid ligase II